MIHSARLILAGLMMCLALPAAAAPQEPATTDAGTLSWIIGSWSGSGTAFGKPSQAKLEIRPVLAGKFLELRYQVASGFEGKAIYKAKDNGQWQAWWFDSHGSLFDIDARVSGHVLSTDWGAKQPAEGHTSYTLLDDGRLEVIDTTLGSDGQRREFARHVFTRAN